nr:uncharacterized protein LOC117275064 isoform X1 [Nicotiana tomentosiformis]
MGKMSTKHCDCFPHPFQALPAKPHPSKANCIKKHSKISWTDAAPNLLNFLFTRVASTKEAGLKQSLCPQTQEYRRLSTDIYFTSNKNREVNKRPIKLQCAILFSGQV